MATFLVTGSIETTIIVSVLNVASPWRWSTPSSRMLSRSVWFQAGTAEGEARGLGVDEGDDPLGGDRGHRPVDEGDDVADQDQVEVRHQQDRGADRAGLEEDPEHQRDEEQGNGGEADRPGPGAGIGMAQTG